MKSIVIGLSPNVEMDDVFKAFIQLINPSLWNNSGGIYYLEKWFRGYFLVQDAISFQNARSALYAILQAFNIQKDDEVILQAFTCVVVPNAVVALGAKPVYIDINNTLTMNLQDLEKKITKKTKAIIVQHTFGIPADMNGVQRIAKKYKLWVIEDVAHTIGGTYKDSKLGTLSDAAIFSFGRDKAFSSIFGGMAITKHKELGEKIRSYQNRLAFPKKRWIAQQLFHPIATRFILALYDSKNIGKILLIILQKLKLLSLPVSLQERYGIFSPLHVYKLANPLALLALHQLKKLEKYNKKREYVSKLYFDTVKKNISIHPAPLLRYPLLVKNPKDAYAYFKKHHIYLGNWYHYVVDPKRTNIRRIQYMLGSCPKAEYAAKHIINLPTNPTMKEEDIERVVSTLKAFYKLNRTKGSKVTN